MSADKRPEHHKRDLLLSDRISQGTVKDIIKDIFEINFDDDEKEEIYKDWERKPIQLFINSYGGSVYDGLALIDVIKRSKTPVHNVLHQVFQVAVDDNYIRGNPTDRMLKELKVAHGHEIEKRKALSM